MISEAQVAEGTAAATLLFQGVYFGGSQRLCHEDTQAALRRVPHGEEQRPLGTLCHLNGAPQNWVLRLQTFRQPQFWLPS